MAVEIAAELFPHLSELADGGSRLKPFRDALARGDAMLRERFEQEESVDVLVRDRARLVDGVLGQAWRQHVGPLADELALVAVGGYGRGELHPCSDIDIMILLPHADDAAWREALETFLTFLWDIGLEVGHSVRTIEDCIEQARADITVATTLMESPGSSSGGSTAPWDHRARSSLCLRRTHARSWGVTPPTSTALPLRR